MRGREDESVLTILSVEHKRVTVREVLCDIFLSKNESASG